MIVKTGEYLPAWDLDALVHRSFKNPKISRAWAYRRQFTTFMVGSGKRATRYKSQWESDATIGEFIEACSRAGFKDPMPSGYAWPWKERHLPPKTNPTTLARLHETTRVSGRRATVPKPWNEALRTGALGAPHYVYDLNSAYAWAASQPLPDPRGTIYTSKVTSRPFGVYLLRSVQWRAPSVPRRLRQDRGHWVTREELDAYDAHAPVVELGMEWERELDLRWDIDEVRETFPAEFAKRILRGFWGAWNSRREVDQYSVGAGLIRPLKSLPARHYCPVWAWHVLARVSARCAAVGGADLAHVFTDAVMLPREIGTGGDCGDWKLVERLADPWVSGAGNYGDGARVLKHAGKVLPTTERQDLTEPKHMEARNVSREIIEHRDGAFAGAG